MEKPRIVKRSFTGYSKKAKSLFNEAEHEIESFMGDMTSMGPGEIPPSLESVEWTSIKRIIQTLGYCKTCWCVQSIKLCFDKNGKLSEFSFPQQLADFSKSAMFQVGMLFFIQRSKLQITFFTPEKDQKPVK